MPVGQHHRFATFAAALLLALPAWTASADDLARQVATCASISDDSPRLDCFDRIARELQSRGESGTTSGGRQLATEREFGASEKLKVRQRVSDGAPPEMESITARIVTLRSLPGGQQVFELDNGQTWEESSPNPRLGARVGDRVTVRRAALGSFLLSTGSGPASRVRRVQ